VIEPPKNKVIAEYCCQCGWEHPLVLSAPQFLKCTNCGHAPCSECGFVESRVEEPITKSRKGKT
jgi:hypothetical protein